MKIVLLPGVYKGTFKIRAKGKSKSPIIIENPSGKAIFDSQLEPVKYGGYCLAIEDSEWIEIHGLKFKNCWPTSLRIKSSRHLTISNISVEGSRHAIRASGDSTKFIILKNSHWNQDPSGKLWKSIPWAEAHHGKFSYFNGSLFSADQIAGDVEIFGNTVENAFNGIRMEGDAERIKTVNANVNIHHNKFIRIRDNPVEPEISAYNWWIHHNEIQNAHAWLSFTEMTGGEIYIFGNLGWNNEPYGIIGDHDEGTVLKFQNAEPFPSMPIYIFHNSWVVNEDYIRPKTPSRNIHHFNNAIFLKDKKSSTLTPRNYDRSYKFENDLISGKVSDFAKSKWKNLTIAEPMFLNITKGDFRLDKKSPAIDSGKKIKIGIWKSIFQGKSPDIGAYEGSVRIAGPEYTPK